ncbi:tyrosine-protein phosphatase [Bacillus piscicola]|uniref:tyrosine-protein phosphatase n=1 Tax=Bacillus piscicola TaxID=1632684 RepID=UPI001F09EA81|nr:CpsB/CapC family capsule biosynthesis tyrosine phosphatase [Bacillus piscicola]
MIDIHTHILPGIDDGPETEEEAVKLAEAAAANGIRTVIATPHHRNGAFTNPGGAVTALAHSFNKTLEQLGVPLHVLAGQEIRIHGEFLEELRTGDAIGLNESRYVFVEFSSVEVPAYARHLFYDVQMEGYVPIIVHPERNKTFVERPDELYRFVKNGALTQITSHCLTGRASKKTNQFAKRLLEHHLTHFIASDAHNTRARSFNLREAYAALTDEFGASYTNLFQTNATRLVENKPVVAEPPERIRKKFLGLF